MSKIPNRPVTRGRPRKRFTVFKRKDSGTYSVRFTLEGYPQFRFGLGTFDEEEAKQLAEEKYFETRKLAANGQIHSDVSFSTLADGYVETLFEEAKRKPKRLGHARHAKSTIDRYLKTYFESTHITNIFLDDLDDYAKWRRVYWTEGDGKDAGPTEHKRGTGTVNIVPQKKEASDSTLKREASFIRGIFKYAVRKRILKPGDVPKISFSKVTGEKRPSFTKEQFNKLALMAEHRMLEAATNPKLLFERHLLFQFINIAVETGMRPGEMFNLNWGHVEGIEEAAAAQLYPTNEDGSLDKTRDRTITIIAQGKGKRPTRFVPKRTAIGSFSGLRDAYRNRFGSYPKHDDPVFCNYDGQRLGTLNRSLNELLKAADLLHNAVGEKFSTYSFRHSYATWQLQKKPPVDIYTLAINMRTSVEMIEKWYSDALPEHQAAILRDDDEYD